MCNIEKHNCECKDKFKGIKSKTLNITLIKDGNLWCFLQGDNLQDGIAGFGNTPQDAVDDFDENYFK